MLIACTSVWSEAVYCSILPWAAWSIHVSCFILLFNPISKQSNCIDQRENEVLTCRIPCICIETWHIYAGSNVNIWLCCVTIALCYIFSLLHILSLRTRPSRVKQCSWRSCNAVTLETQSAALLLPCAVRVLCNLHFARACNQPVNQQTKEHTQTNKQASQTS